ncbi:MAG: hypothetical protein EOP77_01875 [Variovorax sp.]|nr:MAG: hypothetical protein EOP77_01875 [Variovorax sp.]
MADELSSLTAKERLAISRRALVNQLQGGKRAPAPADDSHGEPSTVEPRSSGFLDRFPWASVARNVGERWWRRHPANAMGQLARPLLERYARKQPFKLVAAASAVGALAVLVKPWRLLSVTAVLAALLKTSDVADVVNSLMHKTRPDSDV